MHELKRQASFPRRSLTLSVRGIAVARGDFDRVDGNVPLFIAPIESLPHQLKGEIRFLFTS
jgi:hypothetical protein